MAKIKESKNPLVRSFNSKYSENAHQALKVLGVNILETRYDISCGGLPKEVSLLAKRHAIGKLKVKGKGNIWHLEPAVLWELLERSKNKYWELIKKYHPDKFPAASPREFQEISQRAAIINRAWEVIEYLFKRRGFELAG